MSQTDPSSVRRIELILQQIDSLPTLPSVAVQLLHITNADDTDARQVIDLVKSDQALTAKILGICRHAHMGVRSDIVTIDRAVLLLGFEAIRNAVLSLKVFETFSEDIQPLRDPHPDEFIFNHVEFWKHNLAVAIAAEMIADRHPNYPLLQPDQAFVCGLLHDLGKLALDHILPKSYQRVIEITDKAQVNIVDVEKKVIGIDHHTAGKRLAEHWQLPYIIQDCMWLHGVPYESLPNLEHRQMIGLIGLADLLVRRQHIGYSGNYSLREKLAERVSALGLKTEVVEQVTSEVREELERRAEALGLGKTPTRRLFLDSIMQANSVLGRLNNQLEGRRRISDAQSRSLAAIVLFHASASTPRRSVTDVLSGVVRSASSVFGEGFYGTLYQATKDRQWQISQYNNEGRVVHNQFIDPPPSISELASLYQPDQVSLSWMSILPWMSDYLAAAQDMRKVQFMPLPCAWGAAAVLLHDRSALPTGEPMKALLHTWGAAVAAATQHEGARRLGEELAEATRVLNETQESLLRSESLSRLGEMAAGAAHEMNNPLSVISGRAQLLSMQLPADSRHKSDASLIFEQAQKLSELITALHLFAEPPKPEYRTSSLANIITNAIQRAVQLEPAGPAPRVSLADNLPPLWTDPLQLASALSELIINAMQASKVKTIDIRTQVDLLNDRLILLVNDDAVGMDEHTLAHAFDPFFSAKQAGRRTGLGLPKARRVIEALGGTIELQSRVHEGTSARIAIPLADPPENM